MVSYDGSIKIITNYFIKSIAPETRSCTKRPPPPPPPPAGLTTSGPSHKLCPPSAAFFPIPRSSTFRSGSSPQLAPSPSCPPSHRLPTISANPVLTLCPARVRPRTARQAGAGSAAGLRGAKGWAARGAPPQHRPRGTPPARAPHFRISRRPPGRPPAALRRTGARARGE